MMRSFWHHPIQQLAGKESSISNSSARSNCKPHDLILLRASAAVGPESREAGGCPSFLKERDRRERSFFIEKSSQCTQISPSRTSCACFSPNKKLQRLCVIGCQIARTRIHTLLKRLASARHDYRWKTVLLLECTLQTKQSVKTKEVDGVFSQRPLYCGQAGSDGQQVVFLYVCFRHGSRWRRSPQRSLGDAVRSSHEGEITFLWPTCSPVANSTSSIVVPVTRTHLKPFLSERDGSSPTGVDAILLGMQRLTGFTINRAVKHHG